MAFAAFLAVFKLTIHSALQVILLAASGYIHKKKRIASYINKYGLAPDWDRLHVYFVRTVNAINQYATAKIHCITQPH